jgi:hypothetical protein
MLRGSPRIAWVATMTIHERPVGASVEWYTPSSLFDRLRLRFDLDPASPNPPVPWVPAERFYSVEGELLPWEGRVWLNPPYGPKVIPFVERMIEHDHGLLLLPARTETKIFQKAAAAADYVIFLRDRLHFVRPDGHQARASFGSVLMMFGGFRTDLSMLANVVDADLGWRASNRREIHPLVSVIESPEEHARARSMVDARSRQARYSDL